MKKRTRLLWMLPLIALVAATLACQVDVGGGPNLITPTPAPTVDIQDLQNTLEDTAVTQNPDGTVTLTLTEQQLTDLVVYQLSQSTSSLLTDPRVTLKDGQIIVNGKIQQGVLSADAQVVIDVSVSEDGAPKVEIASADFGPVPVPSGLLDGLSKLVEDGFTTELGSYATGYRFDQITIQDGLLTITGKSR